MPPEESTAPNAPEPAPEPPAPAAEAPAPTPEPSAPPQAAPEATQTPETAQPPPPTAHIPPSEPLPPESPPSREATEGQSEPIKPPPEPPSPAASAPAPATTHFIRDLLVKARVAIQDRKRKKRDKIMQALNTKGKITNDEVEKLLHVSDATATRYLTQLEKEGKIQQVGRTGKSVKYQKL